MTVTLQGITYEPWSGRDDIVGLKLTRADGRVGYLHLHPGDDDEDQQPHAWLYAGPHGDPAFDIPLHFYNIDDDFFAEASPS